MQFADCFSLHAGEIYTENGVLNDHWLHIEHDKIAAISKEPHKTWPTFSFPTLKIMPGMIDLHIHGRDGYDIMDGTDEAIDAISASLAKFGVTGFLGTTVTAKWDVTLKAYQAIGRARNRVLPGAKVLGAYNEGLFFSEEHKGAHNEKFFLPLTQDRIDTIIDASAGSLKMFALAPELKDNMAMIPYLVDKNVVPMLGHTNADGKQTAEALELGACGGVHVFNGMKGIHHRDPGCAGTLLMDNNALVEVIADGIHLHPLIMQMIVQLKGEQKIALISDCINAGGLDDGQYRLGELDIVVEHGVARTLTNSLAGSTLTLNKAVKNMVELAKVNLASAINMASHSPAKHIHVQESVGSIALGKFADLVLMADDCHVHGTIIDGKLCYHSPEIGQFINKS